MMSNTQKMVFKTISYRVMSISITFVISYHFTDSLTAASAIVSLDSAIKMGFYYYHEKVWHKLYKKQKRSRITGEALRTAHKQ